MLPSAAERRELMAIIDSRLLSLIETLVDVGADWLAFEILEGVQTGEVAEEPREKLRITQLNVRSRTRPVKERPWDDAGPAPSVRLRVGDAQLLWAAAYVNQRLRDAVFMLDASFDQIERILSIGPTHEGGPTVPATRGGMTFVLQTDERELSVNKNGLGAAGAELGHLQQALNAWLESAGVRERTE